MDISSIDPRPGEPGQRKRRPHRKTRRGCMNCKRRRIKCDEEHPECRNCYRLSLDCVYPNANATGRDPSSKPTGLWEWEMPLSKNAQHYFGLPPLNPEELNLMHHYSTVTCHSLAVVNVNSEQTSTLWCEYLPELAFKCRPLLHALLSTSAQHKLYFKHEPRDRLLLLATYHHQRSVAGLREELNHFTPESGEALLATSFMIVIRNFETEKQFEGAVKALAKRQKIASSEYNQAVDNGQSSQIQNIQPIQPIGTTNVEIDDLDGNFLEADKEVEEAYHAQIQDIILYRGARAVTGLTFPYIPDQSPLRTMIMDQGAWIADHDKWFRPQKYFDMTDNPFKPFNDLHDLVSLGDYSKTIGEPSDPNVYLKEVNYILGIYRFFTHEPHNLNRPILVTFWLTDLSDEFLALLRGKDERAIVILAHYIGVISIVQHLRWWTEGMAERCFRRIEPLLSEAWRPWLDWPRMKIFSEGQVS